MKARLLRKFFRKTKNWFDRTKYRLVVLNNYWKYGKSIKKELKLIPQKQLNKNQQREIKEYFSTFGFNNLRLKWHQFYGGQSGEYSKNYIPQDLFFSHIEMALNDYKFSNLQDKNLLESIFIGVRQPKTIIKNCNGFYLKDGLVISKSEAIEIALKSQKFIIKPTINTSGGRNVKKIDFLTDLDKSSRKKNLLDLFENYGRNFILQNVIDQSEILQGLNVSSINTLRICTYLRDEGVEILFSVVRFGSNGCHLDNISQGGYLCKVQDDGILNPVAYDYWKKPITVSPGGVKLKGFRIPNYQKVKETAKKLHMQVPYFRIISWDIALESDNEPILIEYNAFGQAIDFQAITGPLFGQYTDEVLKITKNSKLPYF